MGLAIGVSVGSRIKIGEGDIIRVKMLTSPNLIVITVNDGPDIVISENDKKEILPDVLVQSGVGAKGGSNRLTFDAPRAIRIERLEPAREWIEQLPLHKGELK